MITDNIAEEVALEAMEHAATIDRMWGLVLDQQERMMQLERDHARLIRALADNGIALPGVAPQLVEDAATPTTATTYAFDSPSQLLPTSGRLTVSSGGLTPKPPQLARLGSGSLRAGNGKRAEGSSNRSGSAPLPSSPTPPVDLPPPTPAPTNASHSDKSRATAAAHSAAKSFRVTMEDPCWKVLPAALKKYKINDDWKQYALFICFGNTERCLSYDEKPLLLFQKLKEGGQRPVFMLRHIRDIKSPIAVAQQKQALKLGLPPTTSQNLLPTVDTVPSPTEQTDSRPGGRTPGEGGFPDLPSPRDKAEKGAGPEPGTILDVDGKIHKVTYATSIYPYIADRADEFDVAVGATFVVMSKAKGWWFVQKDPEGAGNIVSDPSKSAWVPAGCLLELEKAIAQVSPRSPGKLPGRAPLLPSNIMSSSYPGNVLMDYTAKNENELTLREGERIRVYKKYCHWSYSIKEETGERGWVPAWFVGKIVTENGERERSHHRTNGTAVSPALPSAMTIPGASSAAGGGSLENSSQQTHTTGATSTTLVDNEGQGNPK